MAVIQSRANARVKTIRSLASAKGRKTVGGFLLEGKKVVLEALEKGLVSQLFLAEGQEVPFDGETLVFSKEVFAHMTDTLTAQGVAAFCTWPDLPFPEMAAQVLVLDGLQDPGNVGGLIRTAAAFGVCGVVVTPGTADPFSPKAVRASSGAVLSVPLLTLPAEAVLTRFTDHQVFLAGADGKAMASFDAPFCLVLGSEGQGPSSDWQGPRVQKVGIPVAIESLNVLAAGAVLLDRLIGR